VTPGCLLTLLFFTVPVVEVILLVQVGQRIGWPVTAVLVVATAVIGARLVTYQGRGVLHSARSDLGMGVVPGRQIAHGAMIVAAGALLLTPGFLTDVIGFLLLVPGVRETVRLWAQRRFGGGAIDL
jgi:UPF0716 protein FxsA